MFAGPGTALCARCFVEEGKADLTAVCQEAGEVACLRRDVYKAILSAQSPYRLPQAPKTYMDALTVPHQQRDLGLLLELVAGHKYMQMYSKR